jgi:hypothetical protein
MATRLALKALCHPIAQQTSELGIKFASKGSRLSHHHPALRHPLMSTNVPHQPGSNPPTPQDRPRQNPASSIEQPQKPVRGLTDPPPSETDEGGEQVLSGQSRAQGGERDV